MIEDNIRVLRQAARITNDSSYKIEKSWCIIAGSADHNVKILFREHVILKEGKLDKKFDFIMVYGNSIIINDFKNETKNKGGAVIAIPRKYLVEEPNLMVFIAPDDVIRNAVSIIEKSKVSFAILQESQTTNFINIDISNEVKLPNFIKSALKPFYNANEVVLSTILYGFGAIWWP